MFDKINFNFSNFSTRALFGMHFAHETENIYSDLAEYKVKIKKLN